MVDFVSRFAVLVKTKLILNSKRWTPKPGNRARIPSRPGMTFRDFADQVWDIPEKYYANRLFLSAHGCGMTICVESYICAEGGREGVKLDRQVLVTETGVELPSEFPFEENLMDTDFQPAFPLPRI